MEIDRLFWGDAFTTLVYGSSVGLLATVDTEKHTGSLLALVMIVFLSFDWVSRIMLPHKLPINDVENRLPPVILIKTICEISGVFLVTSSFVSILRINYSDPNTPIHLPYLNFNYGFGLFLLVTFSWNLLLLGVMAELNWYRDLLPMCIKGNALESKSIKFYSGPLLEICDNLKHKAERNFLDAGGDIGKNLGALFTCIKPLAFRGSCRWLFQLFANHLAWTGIFGAFLLLFDGNLYCVSIRESLNGYVFHMINLCIIGFWIPVILTALSLLFLLLVWPNRKSCTSKNQTNIISFVPFMALLIFPIVYWGCYFLWHDSACIALLGILTLGLPLFVYIIAEVALEMHSNNIYKFICSLGSSIMSISLFVSYIVLPLEFLIIFISIEQVIVTLFLFFAASSHNDDIKGTQIAIV
jgi:hypothetical protein